MRRIENGAGEGTPDLYFSGTAFKSGWAELKVSSGKRKIVIPHYSIQQRLWARDHIRSGGLHYLIVQHCGVVYWFKGEHALGPDLYATAAEAIATAFHNGKKWPTD